MSMYSPSYYLNSRPSLGGDSAQIIVFAQVLTPRRSVLRRALSQFLKTLNRENGKAHGKLP